LIVSVIRYIIQQSIIQVKKINVKFVQDNVFVILMVVVHVIKILIEKIKHVSVFFLMFNIISLALHVLIIIFTNKVNASAKLLDIQSYFMWNLTIWSVMLVPMDVLVIRNQAFITANPLHLELACLFQ
jgi:hypothetical protein